MKEITAKWLEPMLVELAEQIEAGKQAATLYQDLLSRSSMPAAEADDPFLNWLIKNVDTRARTCAVDWLRFGSLLRQELGWLLYPADPR